MNELPTKQVKLIFPSNEDMPGGYSNNMFINHGESEFNLYFYEVVSPIVLGSEVEKQEIIDSIQSINALPVARIVVPAKKLKSIIRALQTNLEQYEKRFGALPDTNEESED